MPLADKMRPVTLDHVVGQTHLLGENKPLRKIIQSGYIPNLIFYGPSGTGKTTVASIIAAAANKTLYKLNGTSTSTSEIKEVITSINSFSGMNGILLYLDEIQYLNKKQQQSLLEYIENGDITLIASTTENPHFYIYNAVLSRSTVFQFKPVAAEDTIPAIHRAFDEFAAELGIEHTIENGTVEHIAACSGGDVRKAINFVELCLLAGDNGYVSLEAAKELTGNSHMRYDRDGDEHYDLLSAFQKSIRGSDENAALHYLSRLILAGDLISICRRLLVAACEDIGLAYPGAIPIVKACADIAVQVGFPEARIPLADAVVLLCTAPKSNSAYNAVNMALADIETGNTGGMPVHLRDGNSGSADRTGKTRYKYPHDYKNHYVTQQYLPDEIKDRVYYNFGDNKLEQAANEYRKLIKGG